jgi:menaquinone-specific isochorismate synthase
MTVAPSRSNALPHYSNILHALNVCQRQARQTRTEQIASLRFPLAPVDPLAVLLTLPSAQQRQCYFESPSRGQAIAAWDELVCEQFEGRDRFRLAHQAIETWKARIRNFSSWREGPYFFCSFSFFDTLSTVASGFAPATIVLNRWQVVRQQHQCALIANVGVNVRTRLATLAREIAYQIQRLQTLAPAQRLWGQRPNSRTISSQLSAQEAEQFRQQVRQTVAAIRGQQLQKQVVAHALDITCPEAFQRSTALPLLRSRYPDCYIFSFSGLNQSHFIGASPERLLSIRQGRMVTDALAGSAPRGHTVAEDQHLGQRLLNTPKEQQEHQFVLDFIVERLTAEGLAPRFSTPPGLLRLSNIQHLHTPICADLPSHISPLTLVEALHPTPAVAGVPTMTACESIWRHEVGDRDLYAAPLGWVDPYGNSEFIVGIRSALIDGDRARLYAGAGIVAESDPDQELAEIQLKLQALADALG